MWPYALSNASTKAKRRRFGAVTDVILDRILDVPAACARGTTALTFIPIFGFCCPS
jgi:hypothetical protein